jgi:uncharacterized protein (DUF2236 family)
VAAAEIIGIPSGLVPASTAGLAAYFDAVRPDLACTPAAAEAMSYLVDYLGDAGEEAEMWRDVCDAAIAALPDWAIGLYAGHVPQVREAINRFGDISTSSRMAVRQALGVLDTVFMAEPGVLEARQRIQLRIRAAERAGQ